MTEEDYMLISLAEECAEISEQCNKVIVRVSKTLRFGTKEIQLRQNNTQRITQELEDLIALVETLEEMGVITRNGVEKKKEKVLKFLQYAKLCGRVDV